MKVEAPRTTSSRGRFREYARLQVEVINSLSRHLVEDLGFLESNFLVREGLLHGDRFTAYAGVAGLAEAVQIPMGRGGRLEARGTDWMWKRTCSGRESPTSSPKS